MEYLIQYINALWDIFKDLWLYMFLGFFLAALVDEFVSTKRLLSYFGRNDSLSIARATLAGFLVSSCSCGAIPLAATFRKRGASTATILTFLLAAPWAGLPMIFIFIGFLGLGNTILLMTLALLVAFLSGLTLALFENRMLIEQKINSAHTEEEEEYCLECEIEEEKNKSKEPIRKRILVNVPEHFKKSLISIGKYMMIGLFLAAFLKAYIPTGIVISYLGKQNGVYSILIAIPISAVIEACSEGFALIGGQLYSMGATLSVVFVMTMVGVATDLTEILIVWKKIGKRATVAYITVGTTLALLFACLLFLIT